VGTAEARDVNVAIDSDGRMSMGLLGMTFLRHFRVTVDQQRGQVKFER
jgi:predicted aspartyl protease